MTNDKSQAEQTDGRVSTPQPCDETPAHLFQRFRARDAGCGQPNSPAPRRPRTPQRNDPFSLSLSPPDSPLRYGRVQGRGAGVISVPYLLTFRSGGSGTLQNIMSVIRIITLGPSTLASEATEPALVRLRHGDCQLPHDYNRLHNGREYTLAPVGPRNSCLACPPARQPACRVPRPRHLFRVRQSLNAGYETVRQDGFPQDHRLGLFYQRVLSYTARDAEEYGYVPDFGASRWDTS